MDIGSDGGDLRISTDQYLAENHRMAEWEGEECYLLQGKGDVAVEDGVTGDDFKDSLVLLRERPKRLSANGVIVKEILNLV
jgi:hypothetical protein